MELNLYRFLDDAFNSSGSHDHDPGFLKLDAATQILCSAMAD
jgi:hypothetical protein